MILKEGTTWSQSQEVEKLINTRVEIHEIIRELRQTLIVTCSFILACTTVHILRDLENYICTHTRGKKI